jgi:hypothetical protein
MQLHYFPFSQVGKTPFIESDYLFEYWIRSDPEVESWSLDLGWQADLAVKFWLPTLREELAARLERDRGQLNRRLCCTRIELMRMRREPREVFPLDVRFEGNRLARTLVFQSEQIAFIPETVLSEEVLGIAAQIRESGESNGLPILADALQEAGCNWELLLKHCRSDCNHGDRCWVIDLLERSTPG